VGWQEHIGLPGHVGAAAGGGHPGTDGAAHPAVAAGHLLHAEHRRGADGDDGFGLHDPAAGLCRLSLGAAAHHADAPVAERGIHPRCIARRPHRPRSRRCRDRGLRPLPDRRQLRRRPDRVRHPGGDQLRRDHQGGRAHCRSVGPLHAGCHARQADGGGRRPQRRPDRRKGSQAPPRRSGRGSQFLRLHGRCLQVRARRCRRRHPDPLDQHHRRLRHRRAAARPVGQAGRRQLHPAGHR